MLLASFLYYILWWAKGLPVFSILVLSFPDSESCYISCYQYLVIFNIIMNKMKRQPLWGVVSAIFDAARYVARVSVLINALYA